MSLYSGILRDVQQEIVGLNLVPTVRRRKSPRRGDSEPLPMILVSPAAELAESLHSENTAVFVYPVIITIFQAGDGQLESDIDNLLDWRQAIRRHFHRQNPLPNVTAVFDGEVALDDAFEDKMIPVNYDTSQMRLFFAAEEARDDG